MLCARWCDFEVRADKLRVSSVVRSNRCISLDADAEHVPGCETGGKLSLGKNDGGAAHHAASSADGLTATLCGAEIVSRVQILPARH